MEGAPVDLKAWGWGSPGVSQWVSGGGFGSGSSPIYELITLF